MLPAIVRGEASSLELMTEGSFLQDYCEGAVRVEFCYAQIAKIEEAFAHKNPRARILEVDAGSGANTQVILQALSSSGKLPNPRFAHYGFTNRSSEQLEAAQNQFAEFGDLLGFKTFGIETEPEYQNFPLRCYDTSLSFPGVCTPRRI